MRAICATLTITLTSCTMIGVLRENTLLAQIEDQRRKEEASDLDPWQNIVLASSVSSIFHAIFVAAEDGSVRPRQQLSLPEMQALEQWMLQVVGLGVLFDESLLVKWRLPKLAPARVRITNTGFAAARFRKAGVVDVDVAALRSLHEQASKRYFGGLREHADFYRKVANRDESLAKENRDREPLSSRDSRYLDPKQWRLEMRQMAFHGTLMRSVEFLMLHEMAHAELRHLDVLGRVRNSDRCNEVRLMEFEADEFAAVFASNKPGSLPTEYTKGDAFLSATFGEEIGEQIALVDATELHSGGADSFGCRHPSTAERLKHISNVRKGSLHSASALSPRVRERFCRENNPFICSSTQGFVPRMVDQIKKEQITGMKYLESLLKGRQR